MSVINHIQTGRRYQRCDGQKPQIINKIRQLKQQQANAKQVKLVSAFRWVTEATTYPCWLTHDQGDQMSLFMWDCTRFLCLCPPAPIYQDSVPHFTSSAGCALFWLLPGAYKGSNTVGLMGKSPKVTGLQFLINKMETITKKWISSLHWQMQFLSLRFHTRQKMAWSSRAHHSWLKKCWNCQIWLIKYTTMYGFIHIEIQRWLPDRNAAGRTEIKENTGAYKDHTLVYLYVSIAC